MSLPFRHENHKTPLTRRELLGQGYFGMSALALTPSLSSLLFSHIALGLCEESATSGKTAFLSFDLAGGANIAGSNAMVGGAGGQLDFLPSYIPLGIASAAHPRNQGQINQVLGVAFHSGSALLRGILSTTSEATRNNIDGGVFCAATADDTANNPLNPGYWITKSGAKGELANIVGTSGSLSGGNSAAPGSSISPAMRPVVLNRPEDVVSVVDPGKLVKMLSLADAEKVSKAIQRLSSAQLARFNRQSLPEQVQTLVECGYIKTSAMLTKFNATNLNPRNDADVAAVFNNLADPGQQKVATISKLLLDGVVGTGTVQDGGYDYHNMNRSVGDGKDFAAGALIGQVFELAARKKKDVMIYIFTDGGVTSNGSQDNAVGKPLWTSDSGQHSASLLLAYKASSRPKIRKDNRQVGSYNQSAGVANINLISNSVENLTKAVVANYLALQGREGDLREVVGDNPFQGNFDPYLIFEKG